MPRQMPGAERPVAVLSYDEKPGIQAIATTAPDLPPQPGKHAEVQRDHEYKRLGTVTLSAAVDLVSGVVHHAVTPRHRSREFVAFLQRLDAAYPVGLLICLLLDNHSAHCSRETRRFLESKPGRFELVFTPTHASWLNYVETFFSKMARSVLRRIRVTSPRPNLPSGCSATSSYPMPPRPSQNGSMASPTSLSHSPANPIRQFANAVLAGALT